MIAIVMECATSHRRRGCRGFVALPHAGLGDPRAIVLSHVVHLVVEAGIANADKETRVFLESQGWKYVERRHVAHDWSGFAGRERWVCPVCATGGDS